jgi:Entner-Doudoroff aldolase
MSLDLNHRKQLGTLKQLWSYVQPHLQHLQVMIISLLTLQELAVQEDVPAPDTSVPASDPRWVQLMQTLRSLWKLKRLACCFKTVDSNKLQTRWSVMCTETGVIGTHALPILHRPVDALGGGSAWMAGLLDAFMTQGLDKCDIVSSLRHADLLAALCQETAGDHSTITRDKLDEVEHLFTYQSIDLTTLTQQEDLALKETLNHLMNARVIGIIRGKNADACIQRGLELCQLGCMAVEVTTDTTDAVRVISELSKQLPKTCILGVGTIMDAAQMSVFAPLGVKFALSPIAPTGFIEACHNRGVLAVPSGLTTNELWELYCKGAKLIKLFHAGTISPSILKSILGVGPLQYLNIIPSGGISPENAEAWLSAGAKVVGLGSNLVGKDINFPTGSTKYISAHREWEETGREVARLLFSKGASHHDTSSS